MTELPTTTNNQGHEWELDQNFSHNYHPRYERIETIDDGTVTTHSYYPDLNAVGRLDMRTDGSKRLMEPFYFHTPIAIPGVAENYFEINDYMYEISGQGKMITLTTKGDGSLNSATNNISIETNGIDMHQHYSNGTIDDDTVLIVSTISPELEKEYQEKGKEQDPAKAIYELAEVYESDTQIRNWIFADPTDFDGSVFTHDPTNEEKDNQRKDFISQYREQSLKVIQGFIGETELDHNTLVGITDYIVEGIYLDPDRVENDFGKLDNPELFEELIRENTLTALNQYYDELIKEQSFRLLVSYPSEDTYVVKAKEYMSENGESYLLKEGSTLWYENHVFAFSRENDGRLLIRVRRPDDQQVFIEIPLELDLQDLRDQITDDAHWQEVLDMVQITKKLE